MKKVLVTASVVSFIEWFNKENIKFLLDKLKCEVHIACNFDYFSDTDEIRTLNYIDELKSMGIILHNINFARSPLKRENLLAYKQLKKIIDENHFKLIHCHTPTVAMLTRIASINTRKKGTVVMYTCHGFHFHNSSPLINWIIYYPIERFLSRFCDYLVTINHEDYKRAQSFHALNVKYIPGVGVDVEKFKKINVDKNMYKASLGIPKDGVVMLSIGELIERKNHEVIIRAMAKLQKSNLYYIICGKGPLLEDLFELSKKLKLQDNVVFLGFREDIPELCNIADISAFPSKIEGLGLAGIEAMAAGTPLVASNVHGILDYVIDGITGFACSPNDINAFANSIELLYSNEKLRKDMEGECKKVAEQFSKENALNSMWNIYREIL